MAQMVKILTPEGPKTYLVYNDNRMVAQEYSAGVIGPGSEIIYRGMICEVVKDFLDDGGVRYCELLFKQMLARQPITIMM